MRTTTMISDTMAKPRFTESVLSCDWAVKLCEATTDRKDEAPSKNTITTILTIMARAYLANISFREFLRQWHTLRTLKCIAALHISQLISASFEPIHLIYVATALHIHSFMHLSWTNSMLPLQLQGAIIWPDSYRQIRQTSHRLFDMMNPRSARLWSTSTWGS